uniref:Uncharacterized protein n=1 Tax=Peronospora matthiolae TaxID=2874970 RepID=A0AAV1TUL2_9STRA
MCARRLFSCTNWSVIPNAKGALQERHLYEQRSATHYGVSKAAAEMDHDSLGRSTCDP